MIPRYTPADIAELWAPKAQYEAWFDVELAGCEAMETAGLVPAGVAKKLAPLRGRLDPDRIDAIERTTHHDVIAFLTHLEELGGPDARWLHRGMTSSDVLDSATALRLTRATDRILARFEPIYAALRRHIETHRRTPCMGRSHGIFAEPLAYGMVLAGHLAEFQRAEERLRAARSEIAVGKLAGAVGSYAHLSPAIEAEALSKLGLSPETVSTQVVARDRHAALISALALAAAAVERFATNVRHGQRSEVGEVSEAFSAGQKGSSAMPHKRNPILSENLCGLARIARAYVTPALENIALWYERDISHSSVERMMLPDVTATVAFALDRTARLLEGLVVNVEAMRRNLDAAKGLWASEALLLALVEKGCGRQEAYVWVQRNAMQAFHGEGAFKPLLLADADIRKHLDEAAIDRAFSLEHALQHVDAVIDRALGLPAAGAQR